MSRPIVLTVLVVAALVGGANAVEGPAINYMSSDAVYLNVGRDAGLAAGVHVRVFRDGAQIAVLEVVHVSSNSASCRITEQTKAPALGDMVLFDPVARPTAPDQTAQPSTVAAPPPVTTTTTRARRNLSGYVALESMIQRDHTASAFTSLQPGLRTRLVVDGLWGSDARMLLRYSARAYRRNVGGEKRTDWTQRLTEFAVVGGDRDGVSFGLGRLLVPDLYGLGYVDGAYFATKLPGKFHVGVAGGLEPDFLGSDTRFDRQKVGAFVTYADRFARHTTLDLTGAISGSYSSGVVSREFGYMQLVLGAAERFHLYQSMEIDFNRGWRKEAAGDGVTVSNVIVSGSANITSFATVTAGYDERRNFYDIETYETPDSLFDDRAYSGYRLGATIRIPHGVRLSGTGGLRYRDGSDQTNQFFSVTLSAAGLPRRGHGIALQYSVSQTPFLTGYRPTLLYRFPVTRRLRANAGVGGYLYRATGVHTDTVYIEGGGYFDFARRYFLSGNLREYFGGGLESTQATIELGVNL